MIFIYESHDIYSEDHVLVNLKIMNLKLPHLKKDILKMKHGENIKVLLRLHKYCKFHRVFSSYFLFKKFSFYYFSAEDAGNDVLL